MEVKYVDPSSIAPVATREVEEKTTLSVKKTENVENCAGKPPVVAVTINEDTIKCPSCGMEQNSNRVVCWNCGQGFQ